MPWTAGDAKDHVKGLTDKQARAWAKIATSALARCQKAGGSDCEGAAIKQANAVAQRIAENAWGPSAADLQAALREASVPDDALADTAAAILTELDPGPLPGEPVTEASTRRTTVQGHLRAAATTLQQHAHPMAQRLGRHLARVGSVLQRAGYGGLATLLPEDEPPGTPEPAGEAAARTVADYLLAEVDSVLRTDDAYDARREAIQQALTADRDPDGDGDDDRAEMAADYGPPLCWIVDLYDDVVVYRFGDELYRRTYTIAADDTVTLGAPEEVERAYVPADEAALVSIADLEPIAERTIPQSERDAAKSSDFAGRGDSYPILKPADVAAAASSIGRAGADNYSPAKLRANIIRIARRKGAAFVAQLPKAWRDGSAAQESAGVSPPAPHAPAPAPSSAASVVTLVEAGAGAAGLVVPLQERAVRTDGTGRIKVISPGWGSSGYYSAAMLKRDGPKVIKRGGHLYWDHPTKEEAKARPERSLRDLAAVFESDGRWDDAGPDGPGVYADIKVFTPYREAVNELAPHIGASIRGDGVVTEGQAEGRRGPIIEELKPLASTDFVTLPGRGGKVLELFEAARQRAYSAPADPAAEEAFQVDEREFQALQESATALREQVAALERQQQDAEARNRELAESLVKRDIDRVLLEELSHAQVHAMVRERLTRDLKLVAPVTEGALEADKFRQMIAERLKAELAYLSETTGVASGAIRGLGPSVREAANLEEAEKAFAGALRGFGLDEKTAAIAAAGRR